MSARRDVPLFFWNVLSTSLCTPKSYFEPHYDPVDLDPETRTAAVAARVEAEVSAGKLVALVEVDTVKILPALLPIFDRYNYGVMQQMYGRYYNGFMGVVLAWPREQYELVDCKQTQMGELLYQKYRSRLPARAVEPRFPWYMGGVLSDAVAAGWKQIFPAKPVKLPPNVWAESTRRQNWVLMARLSARSGNTDPFVVAAYHMPCMFFLPPAMLLHADAVMTEVCDFAGEDPTIVAGDWNFGPASHPYQLITGDVGPMAEPAPFATGDGLRPAADSGPVEEAGPDGWKPTLTRRFESACVKAFGHEPASTNQAKMKDGKEFCGVLDFVFLSEGTNWRVAMDPVPGEEHMGRLAPNADLASDHVPLDMSLRF